MMIMRDVNGCTTEEIEDEIAMIEVCNAVADGRMMVLLAELDRRDEWAKRGFASLAGWLTWRTGLDKNAASEHVRVALLMEQMADSCHAWTMAA